MPGYISVNTCKVGDIDLGSDVVITLRGDPKDGAFGVQASLTITKAEWHAFVLKAATPLLRRKGMPLT